MSFKAGDIVGILCDVQPGPFDGEKVISVKTAEGVITGFVPSDELRMAENRWEVRGKVQEINGDILKVMIYGNFFNTNGIANIPRELAMAA